MGLNIPAIAVMANIEEILTMFTNRSSIAISNITIVLN